LSPILHPDEGSILIFQVERKTNGYFKSIFGALEEITEIKKQEKIVPMLLLKAENQKKSPSNHDVNKRFEQVDFKNNDLPEKLVIDIFKRKPNEKTNVIVENNVAYYAKIIAIHSGQNPLPYSLMRTELIKELQEQGSDEYYEKWLRDQKRKIRIKDKRPSYLK
jgi:hypothetical protein